MANGLELLSRTVTGDVAIQRFGAWKRDEDSKLIATVAEFTGKIKWRAVAEAVRTRDHHQCYKRWEVIKVNNKHLGSWTANEVALLNTALEKYGTHAWKKVAAVVVTRTKTQCRYFWRSQQVEDEKKGKWSLEEKVRLETLIERHGTKDWMKIAKEHGTRSADACLNKWLVVRNRTD